MSLRFHEIAETNHRILNPFTEEQLTLLGELCGLTGGMRQLDLCCGKGEMLCRWSAQHGILGTGVDISTVFLEAARARSVELGVAEKVAFIQGDAGQYSADAAAFDIVSCIGATWIGSGLPGTINLMKPSLKAGGLLLIGEPFWNESPPEAAYDALGMKPGDFVSLAETLGRFEEADLELIEMVNADLYGWDRYEAQQWSCIDNFLLENPDDPDARELHQWMANNRRAYLAYGRRYLGWGVFVLRRRSRLAGFHFHAT
jgi:SAM-dependent methyltransferase